MHLQSVLLCSLYLSCTCQLSVALRFLVTHCRFECVGGTTSSSMASMVLAAVLCVMVVVVLAGCASQAQAAYLSNGWGRAHATYYGGPDGEGTMGERLYYLCGFCKL